MCLFVYIMYDQIHLVFYHVHNLPKSLLCILEHVLTAVKPLQNKKGRPAGRPFSFAYFSSR